jgi:hypothetical protein
MDAGLVAGLDLLDCARAAAINLGCVHSADGVAAENELIDAALARRAAAVGAGNLFAASPARSETSGSQIKQLEPAPSLLVLGVEVVDSEGGVCSGYRGRVYR